MFVTLKKTTLVTRPAEDAGGDWLLGGRVLLPNALRRGLDSVRGLDRVGEFGNARPLLVAWPRMSVRAGRGLPRPAW